MSTDPQTSIIPRSQSALDPPRPREPVRLPEIELSEKQLQAVERLARGERVCNIAKDIEVDRGTIYRWRSSDPHFIAALNQWRGRILSETRDRVLALSAGAADAIAKSIAEHDARMGLRVLEKMGCLKPGPDNPIDPFAIFGVGLEDEINRGPVGEGFRVISGLFTREQGERAHELLALGMAIDDLRAGRTTDPRVLKMAGPLPEDLLRKYSGEGAVPTGHLRAVEGSEPNSLASSAEDHLETRSRAKSVVRIETCVLRRTEYR